MIRAFSERLNDARDAKNPGTAGTHDRAGRYDGYSSSVYLIP